MQIIRRLEELEPALAELRRQGEKIALVPTMGALHRGHMEIVAQARQRSDHVVASLFVNPLQFAPGDDFDRYPRQERLDYLMLKAAGVALAWVPQVEHVYPAGFATAVSVSGLSRRWEGEARPGHFDGVATVVAKLLIAVRPNIALFGEKDYQQLAVIRRMVTDLGMAIEIAAVPTVRDDDGLALSSRNAFLSADDRKRAVALPNALYSARDAIASGQSVPSALAEAKQSLVDSGFLRIDYVALVDADTLEPLDEPRGAMRLIAAATIGGTRLIDNIAVETDSVPPR